MVKEKQYIKNLIIKRKLNLYLKDGTFKTTNHNRIISALNLINTNLTNKRKLKILEIGPSYGFTTIDIFEYFKDRNFKLELTAYEKNLFIRIKKLFLNNYILFDNDFLIGIYIKLFDTFFLMNPKRRNIFFSISSKIFQKLWKKIFNLKIFRKSEEIKLVTDDIYKKDIKFLDNLHELKKNRFNILICLNVFNKSYYSFKNIKKNLSEICQYLNDKALVVIGRNLKDKSNISLYRYNKKIHKLTFIKKVNEGWDFKKNEIILE